MDLAPPCYFARLVCTGKVVLRDWLEGGGAGLV